MTPGMKMMMLDKARKSGETPGMNYRYGMDEQPMNRGYKRKSNGRFAPHSGGTEMEIENRFRDRREREHHDPGRHAPMRARYDGGSMGGYEMTDRMPPAYDMEPEGRYNGPRYRDDGYRMNEDGGRMAGFDGGYGMRMHSGAGGQSKAMIGHAESHESKHLDQKTAKKWVEAMGESFPMEETMEALKQRKCRCEPLEFWVIVNAMKSDYPKLAAKYGVDHIDFYADMAVEWLEDRDAKPGKAMNYYRNVVRHE